MAYFLHPKDDSDPKRRQEWERVVSDQIKGDWVSQGEFRLTELDHHLEAKALYICTMIRRFISFMHERSGDDSEKWKRVYIENYALLFPTVELLGKAVFEKPSGGKSTNVYLIAGFHLLNSPATLPSLHPELLTADSIKEINLQIQRENIPLESLKGVQTFPRINHLVSMRNYLLHGISGRPEDQGAMSFQHPWAIAKQLEITVREYWPRLRTDSGETGGWIDRLVNADIYPLPILGSRHVGLSFEKCFIHPDIVEYLENKQKSVFRENRFNGGAKL